MITVRNDGITEPLNDAQSVELIEHINGVFEVSFASIDYANNPAHELIDEKSTVDINGYEFSVKQVRESLGRKEVVAVSAFYDLVGHRQNTIYGGTRTLNEFITFALSDTGWTFTSDVNASAFLPNFGEDNVINLVQDVCKAFNCEYKIMPNKSIHFAEEIGGDNDAQFRYGHNVKALDKSVDITDMRTWIRGYGANGLAVKYTSPIAEIYGTENLEADPIYNEDITQAGDLIEYIKRELTDYPEVSFDLDSVELSVMDLGESVWLIYEPMNIEFKTRVIAKQSTYRDGEIITQSVTLGNTLPKDLGDILAEQRVVIDENRKQTRSRFEQTNELIRTTVERFDGEILEAYSYVDQTADGIMTEVGKVETYVDEEIGDVRAKAQSNFDILAGQITASVTTSKKYTDELFGEVEDELSSNFSILSGRINAKADSTTVTSLGRRVNNVEWDLDAVSGQITSKVSYTDFTGETMVSKINQTASSITFNANKINMQGITEVANSIYIGGRTGRQRREILFGGEYGHSRITSNENMVLELRAALGYISMQSPVSFSDLATFTYPAVFNNSVDFTGASLRGVAAAHSDGIGISYSGNKLYVKVHNSTVGTVTLD